VAGRLGGLGRLSRRRQLVLGQSLSVHLAVAGQGELLQPDKAAGHHIAGQPFLGESTPGVFFQSGAGVEGGELLVLRRLHHHHLVGLRLRLQHRFDAGQLDAFAVDLHLAVPTSQDHQVAVGTEVAKVAGAVDPSVVPLRERLFRPLRHPQIACADPHASHAHLADDPHGSGLSSGVADEVGGVGEGFSVRNDV